MQATRVGETFSCSTAELPCRRVAEAGLEPATTSLRGCSSSGICPQAAQTPTRVQEMFTYSTRLSYPPANRQGGTRTRDPVISCAFGAAVIRYKLQATCTSPYCPERASAPVRQKYFCNPLKIKEKNPCQTSSPTALSCSKMQKI